MRLFVIIAIMIGVAWFRSREEKAGKPEWRFYAVLFIAGITIYMIINPPP